MRIVATIISIGANMRSGITNILWPTKKPKHLISSANPSFFPLQPIHTHHLTEIDHLNFNSFICLLRNFAQAEKLFKIKTAERGKKLCTVKEEKVKQNLSKRVQPAYSASTVQV